MACVRLLAIPLLLAGTKIGLWDRVSCPSFYSVYAGKRSPALGLLCLLTTPALLGGCVAAIIELTAETYLRNDPAMLKVNQPDVLNLHVEFLRVCTHDDSTIKVVPLKIGGTVSTLQLQLL